MENKGKNALYDYDAKLSLRDSVPMGLQHVIAAVVGIVTPGIMVANACGISSKDTTLLIQVSLIFAGIGTLMQIYPLGGILGSRLPVMMGASFAYVPVLMSIGTQYGLATIFGAQIVGSIMVILLGLFIKKIRILFPPLVTGTVVLSIGFSLFPVAIKYMAGGAGTADFGSVKNWIVAIITFAIVFYFNYFGKGVLKLSAILNGMIVGYVLSLILGMVDFATINESSWFQMIIPFHFGFDFKLVPTLTLMIMFLIDAIQAIGHYTATTVGSMDREPTDKELSGGIIGKGASNLLGSFFGALPMATFGQNVGLVTVTKAVNKHIFTFASLLLLAAGFIPKLSAILTTIPKAVIGGATVSVFASISMTGIGMITSKKLTPRDTAVVGISLAFGVGVALSTGCLTGFPEWATTILGDSEVVLTTILAVLLNVILNGVGKENK